MSKKSTPKAVADTMRNEFYQSIAEVIAQARQKSYRAVNSAMVEAYWQIGRMIVEEEQQGKERAEYGASLIKSLAVRLTKEFGRGFTEANLWNFRQFYLTFPANQEEPILYAPRRELALSTGSLPVDNNPERAKPIPSALRSELTWTHYRLLMRVQNLKARAYYLKEAAEQQWSSRALERQINSFYYERLLASREKEPVIDEMRQQTAPLADRPEDFIKDPYVLEFLNLADRASFHERELEQAIIDKLQAFMLELGKGFAFVTRQQQIRTETKNFFIDLVFYNFILKCFVLLDLKTGELTHQDIGQMDMYVRLYEDKFKRPDDNPTIGIILCTEKDETVVKYSVLEENQQLFAAQYQLYLPTEQELIEEIQREKRLILRQRGIAYGERLAV
ncbi:MAG: PDDEXK nuclease domain-containing protein [Caldilineaceae bacterium]